MRGAEQLSSKDYVHLFFSVNSPYVKIQSLALLNNTKLYCHNVPAGKESLDMNLTSYLGYLIHKNKDKKVIYVIVSQDRGYDKVIQFWKGEKGVVITRRSSIDSKVEEQKKVLPNKKMKINLDVQHVLAKANVAVELVNGVASLVSQNYAEDKRKQIIYLTLLSKYGQKDGLQLYNLIKHLL